MDKSEIKVYKSATDWFIWTVVAFVVGVCLWMVWLDPGWFTAIIAFVCLTACVLPLHDVHYDIDGHELVIHCLFQSQRLPIDKISEIRPSRSWLSAPALSLDRIAIKFSDRKVLKSYAPLLISPVRRDEFIAQLLQVNPAIRVYDMP